MDETYDFLSPKPLTTSAFVQGTNFQTPSLNAFKGMDTGIDNLLETDFSSSITMPRPVESTSLLGDAARMQGIGSLVSAGAGLANTLAMMPILREQRKALEQNRKFAAEDQLARRTARSGFNAFKG